MLQENEALAIKHDAVWGRQRQARKENHRHGLAYTRRSQRPECLASHELDSLHPSPCFLCVQAIGVKELGWEQIVELLADKASADPERIQDIHWLAKIFACLHHCMSQGMLPPKALAALRQMAIIPTVGGGAVAPEAGRIYFAPAPGEGEGLNSDLTTVATAAQLNLQSVVTLLRPELLEEMASIGGEFGVADQAQASTLLCQLGVERLSLRELVDEHLLPRLLQEPNQKVSPK